MIIWNNYLNGQGIREGRCYDCGDIVTSNDCSEHLTYPSCAVPEPQIGDDPLKPHMRRRDGRLIPWIPLPEWTPLSNKCSKQGGS